MCQWISIFDELPVLGQRYDAWHYSGREANHGAYVGNWSEEDQRENMRLKGTLYWMALPEKPNASNTKVSSRDETNMDAYLAAGCVADLESGD